MKGYTNLQILDHRQGRFGNQLFRIATLVGQSMKHNVDYFVPNEWEHSGLFPNLKTESSQSISSNIDSIHRESKFGYHNIPQPNKITELQGYFQSVDFFDEYRDSIKNILTIDQSVVNKVFDKFNKDSKKLCIHIRWGDPYDRNVGGGHKGVESRHPVMTLEYYESSIEYILNNSHIDEFLVFTDNHDTKEFINNKFDKYNKPITYVDYSENYIDDFILQSKCNHFVIANSTFSWWSSYLSDSKDKIVCCPLNNEWFGPEYRNFDTSTLLPSEWIKVAQNKKN